MDNGLYGQWTGMDNGRWTGMDYMDKMDGYGQKLD
jgi:hypothetical protein